MNDLDTLNRLRDLHPDGPPLHLGAPGCLPARLEDVLAETPDWDARVCRAVMSFPQGSAPGPNGLRPAHLKDCLRRVSSAAGLRLGLGAFIVSSLQGGLHAAIQQPL